MSNSPLKPTARVVTFGEMLLRLSPPSAERFFQSPQLRCYFGGSEANVAVSLAHFGVESEYVTCLPPNAVGDAALATLRAEGVVTQHVVRAGRRMGLYFVESGSDLRPMRVVYDRVGSAFSELQPNTIPWSDILTGADRFHISGITPALSATAAACAAQVIATARDAGVPVSMDLNYRPAVWGARDPRPVMRPLAAGCDLLMGNPAAAAAMLGVDTETAALADISSLADTARRIRDQFGCRLVALTHREVLSASEHGWSTLLYDGPSDRVYTSRRYQVRVVDRVGGGDAFAAGLIHALLAGRAPEDVIGFATAASALKLTIPGDFNRVSIEEVDSLLASQGKE